MGLTHIARTLLKSRYLLPHESPNDMFIRVARSIDTPESKQFLSVMKKLLFLPNSPTLMNAGTSSGQLSACFVLPVKDSVQGIFSTLTSMAVIHKSGGGTGFSFSHIRPKGDRVSSTGGTASGPVPFIRVFDEATNAVKQGGKRRGANMGVLAASHPDILEFINAKNEGGLKNFNLSVSFDADFFHALRKGSPYDLINPRDGSVWDTTDPHVLLQTLAGAAWRSGDPGVLFHDTINRKNTVPGLGTIEATNPCGEQPLLPFESCNLGSINLSRCVEKGEVNEELLRTVTRLGVEFLDAVIDINRFPLAEIRKKTKNTRKIGLGVMGLADAFIMMGIPYESKEAIACAGRLMRSVAQEARGMSEELGERKGSFPAIDKSIFSGSMRNATVTTIAPTGSLHLIANTSSGIEPIFSLSYKRRIGNTSLTMIHPLLKTFVQSVRSGIDILAEVRRTGTIAHLPVPDDVKELFRTAIEIAPDHHIDMQAAFQKYVDNAVSKTVNLPQTTGADEIYRIFLRARRLGCKGVTVYRYNSKKDQVLSRGCETCRMDP